MKNMIDRKLNKKRSNTKSYSCPIPKGYKPGDNLPVNFTELGTGRRIATFIFTGEQVARMKRVRFGAKYQNGRWAFTWGSTTPKEAIV